mmetsp:Transcript_51168/g.109339  ORF Transcript_51168/g.109339 Transcript_51168/m.109339 type:complete len:240 (+) Transcript_51168:295-1014(+)
MARSGWLLLVAGLYQCRCVGGSLSPVQTLDLCSARSLSCSEYRSLMSLSSTRCRPAYHSSACVAYQSSSIVTFQTSFLCAAHHRRSCGVCEVFFVSPLTCWRRSPSRLLPGPSSTPYSPRASTTKHSRSCETCTGCPRAPHLGCSTPQLTQMPCSRCCVLRWSAAYVCSRSTASRPRRATCSRWPRSRSLQRRSRSSRRGCGWSSPAAMMSVSTRTSRAWPSCARRRAPSAHRSSSGRT